MTRLSAALGLLALAAACSSSSSGPPPAPPAPQQPWVPTPPVYALIGERQELGLSSAQVTSLDSIGVALAAVNQPILMRLRDMQPTGGFGRRVSREDVERTRPMIDTVRENNRRAQQGVQALLTAEQRTRVCRMFAPDAAEVRRRAAQQRDDRAVRGRRSVIVTDTTLVGFGGPWQWCSRSGSGADSARARVDTTRARPDSAAVRRP